MIKIIGDIAVDIGIPYFIKVMQGIPYDIKKGAICRRIDGSRFYVKKAKHLSDAKLKLSPFAYKLAHPSPKELGISYHNF